MEKINPIKYYSPKELSEHWNIVPRTIQRLIMKGEIDALKVGRQFRVKGKSALEYEARNTIKSKYRKNL